jgi:hypothetical protein
MDETEGFGAAPACCDPEVRVIVRVRVRQFAIIVAP